MSSFRSSDNESETTDSSVTEEYYDDGEYDDGEYDDGEYDDGEYDDDYLFTNEKIRCESELDSNTLMFIHDSLYDENYDTEEEFNLVDAISTLDSNSYKLSKSIIYQNFMLQRRIETLEDRINLLISKVDLLSCEKEYFMLQRRIETLEDRINLLISKIDMLSCEKK